MQVTLSSSSLFCGLTGANSQAPAPTEPQGPTMGLAGQDMTPAAPSTLVGYNKPLQVNDDALTRVGHNKPLLLDTADSTSPHTSLNPQPCAPAAPGNAATRADKAAAPGSAAAHSTAPKADPMEIAALELLLAEPANQDMVQHFGGPLKPLPTDTATGQGIQARYGADLGARLSQLQTAQQAVRAEYCKAMDSAMQSPGPNTPGSVHVPATGSGETAEPARWDFDPAAFTRQYASGDSPAQKAFAQLHGSDPLQYKEGRDIDGAAPSAYVLDSFKLEPGYDTHSEWSHDDWKGTRLEQPEHLLSPDHHTKLINKEYLWFDPVHGWSTEGENLKGNWLDRAFPMVVGGLLSMGAMSAVGGLMGAASSTAGSIAQSAVLGAAGSATMQMVTTGKVNFGTMLRSALTAGVSTGIMDASSMGDMLKSSELGTRALAHLGKAGMQGVLQQAIGGKFKDGFANSLLSSAASEVGAHLDQQIKAQLPELDPAQASALKLLSRAATSALRIAGSNDPAASFANDFLMGALQDAAADRKRGQEGRDGQEGAQDKPEGSTASSGLGLKPPRDWVDRLGRSEVSAVSEPFRIEITGIGSTDPDVYNKELIDSAIQRGDNLNPTIANATHLGLVDQNGEVIGSATEMGYGEQMRNVGQLIGDLGVGAAKGLANVIPETLAFGYRMSGYAAAGITSLMDIDRADQMFAQYEKITGRVLDYNNGVQEAAGIVSGLIGPTNALRGAAVAGDMARSRLATSIRTEYELGWNNFVTSGVDVTGNPSVMNSPVAQALRDELLASGRSADFAIRKTEEILKSGLELPTMRNANTGEFFYKLQPLDASGNPLNSAYWMNSSQYSRMQGMNAAEIGNVMGLPAPSTAHGAFNGWQVFETTPRLGTNPMVFESQIAPATQGANYSARGLDFQSIIANPKAWYPARPINTIPGVR